MKKNKTTQLTSRQQSVLQRRRRQIERELPDLISRDQMRKEAANEPTLSGELRRAIQSSRRSLSDIAARTGVPVLSLDEFLTGERTLRSDVLDRLASHLGLALSSRS